LVSALRAVPSNQHFTSSFLADIFATKDTKLNCNLRKATQNTFVQKKKIPSLNVDEINTLALRAVYKNCVG
jgi:hypothetical protein